MHRIKKKLEPSAADTEPITNLCREALQIETIETIDQDSEFTESASLFDYEKSKSTASSTSNYFSWVIYSYIVAVTRLGDAPNSDLTFNVFKPHTIAGKPKPFENKTFQDLNIVLDYNFS